jgi:hypothetical protein
MSDVRTALALVGRADCRAVDDRILAWNRGVETDEPADGAAGMQELARVGAKVEGILEQFEMMRAKIESLESQLAAQSALPAASEQSTTASRAGFSCYVDPSKSEEYWNLNAVAIAVWKSTCWPVGTCWKRSSKTFAPHRGSAERRRTRLQWLVEDGAWTFFFNVFPVCFLILFAAVLAGILDEGNNTKQHITGDWFYMSPLWRYSCPTLV